MSVFIRKKVIIIISLVKEMKLKEKSKNFEYTIVLFIFFIYSIKSLFSSLLLFFCCPFLKKNGLHTTSIEQLSTNKEEKVFTILIGNIHNKKEMYSKKKRIKLVVLLSLQKIKE